MSELNPGSPGSHPGPKTGAKPLRHPGIPILIFILSLTHLVIKTMTEKYMHIEI